MNVQQLLETMLNLSLQQHVVKDKIINELQGKVAELQKQIEEKSA